MGVAHTIPWGKVWIALIPIFSTAFRFRFFLAIYHTHDSFLTVNQNAALVYLVSYSKAQDICFISVVRSIDQTSFIKNTLNSE